MARVQRNLLASSGMLIGCGYIKVFVAVMNKLVHLDGLVACVAEYFIKNRHKLPIRAKAHRDAIVDKMLASLRQE